MQAASAALLAIIGGYLAETHLAQGVGLCAAAAGWTLIQRASLPGRVLSLAALLILFFIGFDGARSTQAPLSTIPKGYFRYKGILADDPVSTDGGFRLTVDLEAFGLTSDARWQPQSGRVYLSLAGFPERRLSKGDLLVFKASFRSPRGFMNPGSEWYESYLRRKGISARGYVSWPGSLVVASPAEGMAPLEGWRRNISLRMERASPGAGGALVKALGIGDRSGISTEIFDLFRKSGTAHLLAISGLHLGIIAFFLYPLTRFVVCRLPGAGISFPVDPWARFALLPFLGFYTAVAGFKPTTTRAFLMACVLIAATGISRKVGGTAVLVAVALLMALWEPSVLGDTGFQLSLAALQGLFVLAPAWEAYLKERFFSSPIPLRKKRFIEPLAIARPFLVSAAAVATTFPLVTYYFGSASVAGLAVNPLALLLSGFLILPLALSGVVVDALLPSLSSLLWRASGELSQLMIYLLEPVGKLDPGLVLRPLTTVAGMAGWWLMLWSSCFLLKRRRWLPLFVAGALLFCWPVAEEKIGAALDGDLKVWVFDVGHGQAVAMRLPGDDWVLVDGGGISGSRFDVGRRVVAPALRSLGCEELWLMISSHPHPDHLGGLLSVAEELPPERLLLPATFRGDGRYEKLIELVGRSKTRWVGAEEIPAADGAVIEMLCLPGKSENDRSALVKVSVGERTLLIPSDLEAGGQSAALETGFGPECDIFIAPHHGGEDAVNREFLRRASPEFALVSAPAGKGGSREAFRKAAAAVGAKVYTTGEAGYLSATLGRKGVRMTSPKR